MPLRKTLREALGLVSLYNESLGTVSTQYLYDRVQDRDRGRSQAAWNSYSERGPSGSSSSAGILLQRSREAGIWRFVRHRIDTSDISNRGTVTQPAVPCELGNSLKDFRETPNASGTAERIGVEEGRHAG